MSMHARLRMNSGATDVRHSLTLLALVESLLAHPVSTGFIKIAFVIVIAATVFAFIVFVAIVLARGA